MHFFVKLNDRKADFKPFDASWKTTYFVIFSDFPFVYWGGNPPGPTPYFNEGLGLYISTEEEIMTS